MKKVHLPAGALAALLLGGCSLPVKNIHTEILIDADQQQVWETLADLERYPEWNPYHVLVQGELR